MKNTTMRIRSCLAAAVLLCGAPTAHPDIRLMIPFDEGVHGCEGAANPFVSTGNTRRVEDPFRPGYVLEFDGHLREDGQPRRTEDKSALIIDPANLPVETGTVGFSVRMTGQCGWSDGKRTWLAVLVPAVGEGLFRAENDDGTALALFKDADDHLVLGVYQCHDGRHAPTLGTPQLDMAEPDEIAARIPTAHLGETDWARVRFSWDRTAGRVWLALDEHIESAAVTLRPAGFQALLVGTPSWINFTPPKTRGLEGRIDDLVIVAQTLGEAPETALALPAARPPMARPGPRRREARHLRGKAPGDEMERRVRTHFDTIADVQRHGGWAFSCSTPSGLFFLSNKVVLPYSRNYFSGQKQQNSAHIAIRFLGAYLTLDEPRYLEVAERTAHALLSLQRDDGTWPDDAYFDARLGRLVELGHRHVKASLEDSVQAHPILLLFLLAELTGNTEFAQAAQRGVEFLLRAQNPNGSWSHHFDRDTGAGQTARGHRHGGEINDYATSNQMLIMLMAYRRTGDPRYLNAYLRGADWLTDAFIDAGAKGWAQQYDAENNPVEARHFEPAAVALGEGTDSAPARLIEAWNLTGDPRYVAPLKTWHDWMMAHRVFLDEERTAWGWFTYYDIKTGRPISMARREISFLDPAGRPQVVGGSIQGILNRIADIDPGQPPSRTPAAPARLDEESARALLIAQEGAVFFGEDPDADSLRPLPLNAMHPTFDMTAGSWLHWTGSPSSPSGPAINPLRGQASILCRSIYLRRQILGQIPWDGRLSHMTARPWSWLDPFEYAMPSHILRAPLSDEEIHRARAVEPVADGDRP